MNSAFANAKGWSDKKASMEGDLGLGVKLVSPDRNHHGNL